MQRCAAVLKHGCCSTGSLSVGVLASLAVTEPEAHLFSKPSTGELSTHASSGAMGAVSSVGHSEARPWHSTEADLKNEAKNASQYELSGVCDAAVPQLQALLRRNER